jgi:HPr kinase/phosphorylase
LGFLYRISVVQDVLHASAIAFGGQGILLTGRSGAGKSTLAWQLIGLGAVLVADDRVCAKEQDGALRLSAPDHLRGKIEARGLGVLSVPAEPAWARLVVDLDQVEQDRVPETRTRRVAGVSLPLIYRVESPAFAPMLQAYLNGGVWDGRRTNVRKT